ncbi:collagenase-like [Nasonia vitripennis]|uniref:Peptidase S1 domain-containing protein n=1 Tax=Nasonia vitripennis TaxID=7425 RepID=A0A7M7HG62_NASVI|nr:collagenase-like [Nasonia vitripennis]
MSGLWSLLCLLGISLTYVSCQTTDTTINETDAAINETDVPVVNRKSRILNGWVSEERDYRYLVSVMRLTNDVPTLLCGGAIIHRRYILTGAHCVHKYRSIDLVVRSGGVEAAHPSTPQKERRSFHRVVKTFFPRQYANTPCRKHQHDIAILKVQQIFDLSDDTRYRKVILPEQDADYEGVYGVVTGYGPDYHRESNTTNQPHGIENYYLQYVNKVRALTLVVIPNEVCQERASVVITEKTICAQTCVPNAQTCFEDDGGPLVHGGVIIGILNDRQCNPEIPEMFTRVSKYLYFIKNVLEHQISYDIVVR